MTRDNVDKLRAAVLAEPELLDKPGKVLYSTGSTLRPHDIYFLGTKPGGTLPSTIRQSLEDLDNGRNEYLDYSWEGRPPGQQKLQKQVRRFLEGLGFDVRSVPASNIVLTRERSIGTHPDLDGDAARCWPIHKTIISLVRPRAIVAFGSGERQSPFAYLRDFLKPENVETIDAQQGTFSCHRFQAELDGRPLSVVAVPHLTRYSPYTKPEIMRWVSDWIERAD
ncbi:MULTISPECIES: hypothetical protein [unclassified Thioalkalivibrio]|uniref:hypothetical protein n=1 Tax=unclassified Thioalkalivibrio TaxID=2621013 RepID=UPI00035FB7E7|nr:MULTISPECIES: hypothetical protein [unclassified Thioalkalivibrio]